MPAGYDYSASTVAHSPLTEQELRDLEQTIGYTEPDAALLRRHAALFSERAETMVDSWRSIIAAQPHLAKWFFTPEGAPDEQYKARVKARFVQWVKDVSTRPHDRDWLNYQEEIGLRHTPAKKNATDSRHTPSHVPLRFLLGFIPIVTPLHHLFSDAISDTSELARLEQAWSRAVHLHVVLWSRPYTREGLW